MCAIFYLPKETYSTFVSQLEAVINVVCTVQVLRLRTNYCDLQNFTTNKWNLHMVMQDLTVAKPVKIKKKLAICKPGHI